MTLLETAEGKRPAVWFGAGIDCNAINDMESRVMQLTEGQKRTLYIPIGLLSSSNSNYTNSQTEGTFGWVKLNADGTRLQVSDFRILDFAG